MKKFNYTSIEENLINENDPTNTGHKIITGTIPILLTAPHSVTQTRGGNIKIGEFRTGTIANALQHLTSCHIAYKTKNLNDDANYDNPCRFKSCHQQ